MQKLVNPLLGKQDNNMCRANYILLAIVFIELTFCRFANCSDIEYVYYPDKTNIEFGQSANINLSIKNNTNNDIQICVPPTSGKNEISYFVKGNKKTVVDKYTIPIPEKDKLEILKIPKHSKIDLSATQYDREYIKSPGIWEIRMIDEYTNSCKELNIEAWTGTITSNVITIIANEKEEFSDEIMLEATLLEARIGNKNDIVNAFVPDIERQNYFMNLKVNKVISGKYFAKYIGIKLHSPSVTFGIDKDSANGKKFRLKLKKLQQNDGSIVLLVDPDSKEIN